MRIRRVVVLLFLAVYSAYGQQDTSKDPLYQTISQLDAELFGAMNRCNMDKFGSYWADDLEFYQDKDGLSIGSKSMLDSTRKNVCGKFVRELVPGSLEVHSIPNYGAIEIGTHRFLHPYAQDHGVIGEARFINVWRLKDGHWQITRAFSYGHTVVK
jgi:hypothetical protein